MATRTPTFHLARPRARAIAAERLPVPVAGGVMFGLAMLSWYATVELALRLF